MIILQGPYDDHSLSSCPSVQSFMKTLYYTLDISNLNHCIRNECPPKSSNQYSAILHGIEDVICEAVMKHIVEFKSMYFRNICTFFSAIQSGMLGNSDGSPQKYHLDSTYPREEINDIYPSSLVISKFVFIMLNKCLGRILELLRNIRLQTRCSNQDWPTSLSQAYLRLADLCMLWRQAGLMYIGDTCKIYHWVIKHYLMQLLMSYF